MDQPQDIAHRLELFTDSYHETARLGKLFRQVRRTRRQAKEAQELNGPIVDWAATNRPAVKHLERLLGTLRNIQELQKKRQYHPRTEILKDACKSYDGGEGEISHIKWKRRG